MKPAARTCAASRHLDGNFYQRKGEVVEACVFCGKQRNIHPHILTKADRTRAKREA